MIRTLPPAAGRMLLMIFVRFAAVCGKTLATHETAGPRLTR